MTTNDKTGTVERWLTQGFKQYGQVTPKAGLENRVLRNLSTQRGTSAYSWRWMPVLAGIIVIASVAIFWPKQTSQPRIKTAVVLPQPVQTRPVLQIAVKTSKASPPHAVVKTAHRAIIAATPKLDQFPSLRPLSQQEELLLAYIQQVPKEDLKLNLRSDIRVEPLSVKNLDIPRLAKLEPSSDSNN